MRRVSAKLPDFPWDTIAAARARAAAHPGGIVDLSVGTPVDPVPPLIQAALSSVADVPGYPQTHGTPELRAAVADAMKRRFGVTGLAPAAVLPVIGTKELIAALPSLLGLGSADLVVVPEVAYPTYEVSCLLAGTRMLRADGLIALGPAVLAGRSAGFAPVSDGRSAGSAPVPALIYLNSPSNPTGKVLGVRHLRKVVAFARERGAVVAADECYLGLIWDGAAASILDPAVCDGDHTGLLAIHSLSKTSNLAGYRAGFVAGDPELVAELLAVRKHAGMIVPFPVQAAMTAALRDDEHTVVQRARYADRRDVLRAALRAAGLRIDHSEAGLYLWATRDEPCRDTVDWFAGRGVLVAPGDFYGPAGARHVRVALTATDDRVAAAAGRLAP